MKYNAALPVSVHKCVCTCTCVPWESWAWNMTSTALAGGPLGFLAFLCLGEFTGQYIAARGHWLPSGASDEGLQPIL